MKDPEPKKAEKLLESHQAEEEEKYSLNISKQQVENKECPNLKTGLSSQVFFLLLAITYFSSCKIP